MNPEKPTDKPIPIEPDKSTIPASPLPVPPSTTPSKGQVVVTPKPKPDVEKPIEPTKKPEVAEAVVGGGFFPRSSGEEGGRAAAAAGTLLGLLLAASSVMWAVYKFKPGLLSGAAQNTLQISAPRAATNLPLARAQAAAAAENGSLLQEARPLLSAPRIAPPSNIPMATQTTIDGVRMASLTDYFASISGGSISMTGTSISATAAARGGASRAVQTDLAFGGAGSGYGLTASLANGSAMNTLSAPMKGRGGTLAGTAAPRSPGGQPPAVEVDEYASMARNAPSYAPPPRSPRAQDADIEEPLLAPSRAPKARDAQRMTQYDEPLLIQSSYISEVQSGHQPSAMSDSDEPYLAATRASSNQSQWRSDNNQSLANSYNESSYQSNVINTNVYSETLVMQQAARKQQQEAAAAAAAIEANRMRGMASIETQTMPMNRMANGYEQVSYVDGSIMVDSTRQQAAMAGYTSEDELHRHMGGVKQQYSSDNMAYSRRDGGLSSQASVDSQFSSYRMKNTSLLTTIAYDARRQSSANLLAAEEIRVDCIVLTADGRYVVTGSIFGPPQVWDLEVNNQLNAFTLIEYIFRE